MNREHTHEIVIDIETIPLEAEWVREWVADTVTPPASIKKQETLDKWYAEKYDAAVTEKLAKCGLHGETAQIICIGYAIGDDEPEAFYSDDEKWVLTEFFKRMNEKLGDFNIHEWAGHNIHGFDLKVIRQRAMAWGIEVPFCLRAAMSDKWGERIYDTQLRWTGSNREYIGLDKLCLALGVPSPKDGMDGSDVWSAYKQGRHEQIQEYCKKDVQATRAVYRQMKKAM